MGVGRKKQLAKHHIQKTDIERDNELGGGTTLGHKSIDSSLIVECEITDGEVQLKKGRRVRLIDLKGPQVEVFISARQIGVATAVSSVTLRERFALAKRKDRAVSGVVVEVGEFGGTFMVEVR